jgi:predicted PurR-regulated permease PerM
MSTPPQQPTTVALIPEHSQDQLSTRTIVKVIAIVLTVILTIVLVRLLWQPIAWILIAMFLAIALSGPVNLLARRMRRGLAITVVYVTVLLVPVAIASLIVPPLVRQGVDFVNDLPRYSRDLQREIQKNDRLRKLNDDLKVTDQINKFADDAPGKIGEAAGVLGDIGSAIVSSIFAGFTIFVLSIFMVARGRTWIDAGLDLRGGTSSEAIRAALDRIANAVGSYVGGAIAQATVAGLTAFIVLTILGVPFAGALAILMAFGDLIPLVGATLAAILIGVVTLFNDFPGDTIIWAIFAVGYQQFENYVVQPQIQKRAVELEPFVILVSVLFGGTLFGVPGALLAIPTAATFQISLQEWWRYRMANQLLVVSDDPSIVSGPREPPPETGQPPPAPA